MPFTPFNRSKLQLFFLSRNCSRSAELSGPECPVSSLRTKSVWHFGGKKKMSNTHCRKTVGAPSGTLWQARTVAGDKVAPLSLHGVRCGTCYTAVSLPGALVHHCGVTFHRDNAQTSSDQSATFRNKLNLLLLELSKGKAHQWSSRRLFDCLNQRVEPCMSLAFISCPRRFAFATQHPFFLLFDWLLLGNQCHSNDDDDGRTF